MLVNLINIHTFIFILTIIKIETRKKKNKK